MLRMSTINDTLTELVNNMRSVHIQPKPGCRTSFPRLFMWTLNSIVTHSTLNLSKSNIKLLLLLFAVIQVQ